MGITGLLPIVKPAIKIKPIINYKKTRIGIDGHSWLYQMAHAFADQIFYDIPTRNHVFPFLNKIKNLKKHKIHPVFVFDGDSLPSKSVTIIARQEKKERIKEEINQLLKRGDQKRAKELMRQCISIKPEYLAVIIEMLRQENIEYIISPYESDAQLCYLQKIEYINYIMTEDSDFIAYGCDKVLYKFDGDKVHEFVRSLLPKVKGDFFSDNVLDICILSGCDYLSSIRGIGLLTAYKYLLKHKTVKEVVDNLKNSKDVPENYLSEFERAKKTFLEHIVYDPIMKKRLHLSGKEKLENNEEYEFLGSIDLENAIGLALGSNILKKKGPLELFGIKGDIKNDDNAINFTEKITLVSERKGISTEKKPIIVDENEYSPFFQKEKR